MASCWGSAAFVQTDNIKATEWQNIQETEIEYYRHQGIVFPHIGDVVLTATPENQ
jgi:hypothetical protein